MIVNATSSDSGESELKIKGQLPLYLFDLFEYGVDVTSLTNPFYLFYEFLARLAIRLSPFLGSSISA